MKIVWSWLKDYLPNLKIDAEKVIDKLNLRSFEVESLEKIGNYSGVVVGFVKSCEKHPNADKLHVCEVEVGKNKSETIVCGAANVAAGQKVAVALPGALLPGGFIIEQRDLRGVTSSGMICSAKELGLASDSNGIMVLPNEIKTGEDVAKLFSDLVIDLKVLPNRPDAMSHFGIAREVSVIFDTDLVLPKMPMVKYKTPKSLTVKIEDRSKCSRYIGALISGIKVAESPDWLKTRLSLAGMRPINNIVDITNYVMLELGQPMHAFDAAKIIEKGKIEIKVRAAKDGEQLETLDGISRKLHSTDLVIADNNKAIAIAGVMGGSNSDVLNDTTSIILESASFDPKSIRITSKLFGLRSEASSRFERGIDPNLANLALERAIGFITDITGGKLQEVCDQKNFKQIINKIIFTQGQVSEFLGFDIPEKSILQILTNLGFSIEKTSSNYVVIPPSFRRDILEKADVMEELVRIYGLSNVPSTLPGGVFPVPAETSSALTVRLAREVLISQGFWELKTFSFMSQENVERFGLDKKRLAELKNPLSQEYQYMRSSMMPSMLSAVQENQESKDLHLFSIEKRYEKEGKGFTESDLLTGLVTDATRVSFYPNSEEFYRAKGVIENLAQSLGFEIDFKPVKTTNFHPGKTAAIYCGDTEIGLIGEVNPILLKKLNIEKPVAFFEISIKAIAAKTGMTTYRVVSKFPSSKFDLSLLAPKDLEIAKIKKTAFLGSELLVEFELFDYYEGKGVAEDKKSVAFHALLQVQDHTLQDHEIKRAREGILVELNKIGIGLRS